MKHSFGSDNHSGIAPEILEAIINANPNFSIGYGEDTFTTQAETLFKRLLGNESQVFFVFNGTGANILCLKAMTNSFNAIICPDSAHINVDECGAPEKLTGCKLIPIKSTNGKITPVDVKKELKGFGIQHHSQIKVLSISQPTEFGTLYTADEIKSLADLMHENNCYLHVDGSRIANASAALNSSIKSFIVDTGVDALSFGGTKNGLMIGEAVIFFRKELAENFKYLKKQSAQLFSKNRFIAAQFSAYLNNDLYLKLASNSNDMAKYLESKISTIPQIQLSRPVQTNAVFAYIPKDLCKKIQKKHFFYIWDEDTYEVRLMCSFCTTKEDIDDFITDLNSLI